MYLALQLVSRHLGEARIFACVQRRSRLTGGTVDGGAAADENFLERCAAVEAGLAGAAVDFVFELEEASNAVGIDVVGYGGAAELDGVVKDVDQGGTEAGELRAGELTGPAARANAGAKEALVGVDVANAVEQRLAQQSGLDGELAAAKERGKLGIGDGEGFGAGAEIELGGADGEPAEAAGVDEAQLMAAGERENSMGVWRKRNLRRGDEQAAGHAEVDEELGGWAGGMAEGCDDGLADAADAVDAGMGEDVDDFGFGGLEGLRLAAGPDVLDALAVDAGVDAVGDGFDFGQLRHRLILSLGCGVHGWSDKLWRG